MGDSSCSEVGAASLFGRSFGTGVEQTDFTEPHEFHLEQNYPNPFNPSTMIKYSITHVMNVKLKIYDVLGREIAILVNEIKPAGSYQVEWNAAHLPSGVYFFQIIGGNDFVSTKKLVLLK